MLIISKKNMKNIIKLFRKLECHKSMLGDMILFDRSISNKDFCNISMLGAKVIATASARYTNYSEEDAAPFTYSLSSIESLLKASGDWISISSVEIKVGDVSIANKEYAPYIAKAIKSQTKRMDMELIRSLACITYKEYKELLEVSASAATDDTRPILKGVCFNGKEVAALDGYTLSRRSNESLPTDMDFVALPLPLKSISTITGIKPDTNVTILHEKTNMNALATVLVSVGGIDYTVETIPFEGDYIRYNSLVPYEFKYIISPTDLKGLASGIDMLCSAKFTVPKGHTTSTCDFKFQPDNTYSISRITDSGVITYNGEFTGDINEEFGISFNGKYLKKAISFMDDGFTISLNSRVSPAIIKNTTGSKLEMILPVRVAK